MAGRADDGLAPRRAAPHLLPIDREHCAAPPVPRRRATRERAPSVLTASGGPFRDASAPHLRRDATPAEALGAPDLVDGAQDHDRLGHADEQGARGHRGPLAVRRAGASGSSVVIHPAVDRALAGRVHRRHGAGAARRHRHAHADPVRALVSRALGGRHPAASTSARSCSSSSSRPITSTSPASALAYRALERAGSAPGGAERRQRGGGRRLPRAGGSRSRPSPRRSPR